MNTSSGGITHDFKKSYKYTKSYINSYGEKKN